MPERDPAVHAELDAALLEQLTRKEERICMLEALLEETRQRTDALEQAVCQPQTASASPPSAPHERPLIPLSYFRGSPADAIANVVMAQALPKTDPVISSLPSRREAQKAQDQDIAEGYEPTARIDSSSLRRSHRALAGGRTALRRLSEAALLGLGVVALGAGVWGFQAMNARSSSRRQVNKEMIQEARGTNQTTLAAALPRDVAAPGNVINTRPNVGNTPPGITAPTTIILPAEDASPLTASRPASASSRTAHPSAEKLPALAARHLAAFSATAPRAGTSLIVPAPHRTYKQVVSAPERFSIHGVRQSAAHTPLHAPVRSIVSAAPRRVPMEQSDGRTAQLHTAEHDEVANFKAYSPAASSDTAAARVDYGLGTRLRRDTQEGSEVSGSPRLSPASRRNLQAHVDHALETLDKMSRLLDTVEQRRRMAARP